MASKWFEARVTESAYPLWKDDRVVVRSNDGLSFTAVAVNDPHFLRTFDVEEAKLHLRSIRDSKGHVVLAGRAIASDAERSVSRCYGG